MLANYSDQQQLSSSNSSGSISSRRGVSRGGRNGGGSVEGSAICYTWKSRDRAVELAWLVLIGIMVLPNEKAFKKSIETSITIWSCSAATVVDHRPLTLLFTRIHFEVSITPTLYTCLNARVSSYIVTSELIRWPTTGKVCFQAL